MGHELSYWQGRPEEERLRWLAAVGPERLGELLGGPELHVPLEIQQVADAMPRPDPTATLWAGPGVPLGSNNWILGGSRTASGTPLLANDPHLPLPLPGLWYQVQIHSPDYEVAGVTLPGFPFVVIGQGPDLAWGLTNVMLDDHDLFLERLSDDGLAVQRDDAWLPLEVTQERIVRTRGAAETQTVRYTELGVLLEADEERGLPPRSLAWTGDEPADSASLLMALARAKSVGDLVGALEDYGAPAQNLVAADRHGGLLYTAIGRAPARRRGDGRLPAPGWNTEYGWDGLQAQIGNPTVLQPAADLFVTANQDLGLADGRGELPPFSADFLSSHRADRIHELLISRRDWAPEQLARVQTDIFSRYALELVELVKGEYAGNAGRALALLESWDGAMGPEGTAALFALFDRELRDATFGDEARRLGLPPLAWDLAQPHAGDPLLRVLRSEISQDWLDDVGTPEPESRVQIVTRALEAAWSEAVERWGEDPADWSYGELHPLKLTSPLGTLPVLGGWLNRGPIPMAGSATTVAAFGGRWRGGSRPVQYGPSLRWIADPAVPDGSLLVLPAGQSGHPADPHYDDQMAAYLAGELHPVYWSEEAIAAATVSTLTLNPSR